MRWCCGQDAGSLSQRSPIQSLACAEFIFCSSAHYLGSPSHSSLRGRINEYQSSAREVTTGCVILSVIPRTTLELALLPAQNHLERRRASLIKADDRERVAELLVDITFFTFLFHIQ